MSLAVAALLALGEAAAADVERVAGTRWELEGAAWSAPERARLDALAARLPDAYRDVPVRFERAAAPALTDLTSPHTVVRARGRTLVVGVEGLEARVAASGAAGGDVATTLLERQLVHALTHRVDAEAGWSREEGWRRLSGWGPFGPPAEEDLASFATPHGRASAQEDLATLAERYFVATPLPGETGEAARCRLPSKWAFFADRVDGPPAPDGARCAELAQVGLDPSAIEAVEILYARASARSPASLVGHLLVGLVYAPTAKSAGRTDVYELVAVTDGTARNSLKYVLRGLFGGFGSRVQREPLRFAVLRYAKENRGVQRFRVRLDAAQERALLVRLDELRQGWNRDYLFLQRNCTHLPKELLEAALGADLGLPDIYGPDALLGELARRDMLEAMPAASLEEHSAQDRAHAAEALRADAAAALVAAHPELALEAAFADTRAPRAEDRGRGYAALTGIARGGPEDVREGLVRYLAWSDEIENLRIFRAGGAVPDDDPAMAALWAGLALGREGDAAVAGGAAPQAAAGGARAADPTGHDALLGALAHTERAGTTHTPLQRYTVEGVVGAGDGGLAPGLALGSALYGFELGEARRYAAPTGLSVHLLPWEVHAGWGVSEGAPRVRGRLTALRLRRLYGARPVGNVGFYATLADLDARSGGDTVLTGLDAGAAVELWQAADHRHHVGLTGGVAVGGGDYEGLGWRAGLATPVRLFARVGSGTQALTALELDAEWRPTWTVDRRWTALEGRARAGVRLGEVGGVDVGLVGEYRAVVRDVAAPALDHEARLGLRFEPY